MDQYNNNIINKVWLQKCLQINLYVYVIWAVVIGFLLFVKLPFLEHLTKYQSLTVYTLLTVLEAVRINIGYYGNMKNGVPELAGFLMMTYLMHLPLICFFIFNPYLMSTPTEIILHAILFLMGSSGAGFGHVQLAEALDYASNIYLCRFKDRNNPAPCLY